MAGISLVHVIFTVTYWNPSPQCCKLINTTDWQQTEGLCQTQRFSTSRFIFIFLLIVFPPGFSFLSAAVEVYRESPEVVHRRITVRLSNSGQRETGTVKHYKNIHVINMPDHPLPRTPSKSTWSPLWLTFRQGSFWNVKRCDRGNLHRHNKMLTTGNRSKKSLKNSFKGPLFPMCQANWAYKHTEAFHGAISKLSE